ncbi:sensor domain-containing diguanylate cyclase [Lampropedia puyangensis]|uniref:Sensor domain-containing diguanylate cyclase n=1 Tax=Lampropedia puyangensis TaxID=1330072 RepID=A0A4S8EXE2_9BURK|nr:sensor domain-containing diguanylate cyclase [Lampropedia puyangensis]THT99256.1 sensor domain-containing diguanylate cyclase [Lampropedia puyangensis]
MIDFPPGVAMDTGASLPLKFLLPHLEQVMQAMPIGVLWTQLPQGQVLFANAAFDQLFGYPKGYFSSMDQLLEDTVRYEKQRDLLRDLLVQAMAAKGVKATTLLSKEMDIWAGNDEFKTILQNGQILHDEQLLVTTYMDITSIRQNHLQLREYAYKDPLTGLANRRALKEWWDREIWPEKHSVALVLIDLDGFKPINDRLGHTAGDALLRRLGDRLHKSVRERDLVCRLGGDEFVVMLRRPGNADTVAAVCARIAQNLHRAILIEQEELHIKACMGVCQFPEQALDWDSLFQRADQALYAAKASGSGTLLWAPDRLAPAMPSETVVVNATSDVVAAKAL